MRFKNILPKLNNQKGLTGVDVVVSMSVIVMTIVVITMIYINIDLNSKAVNRAAGATRIATTIMEQIEKLYYYEFSKEIENIKTMSQTSDSGVEYDDSTSTYKITGRDVTTKKFFNVKIPNGYIVELTFSDSYGSAASPIIEFDLVKSIDIKVFYTVGNNEKEVSLSTVKQRESVGECNPPELDRAVLATAGISSTDTIVCIKYSHSLGDYIETTPNDPEWYNYSSGEWARILAIPIPYNRETYVDASGHLKRDIVYGGPVLEDIQYVWIPNYALKNDGSGEVFFRYSNGKHRIIPAGEPDGKLTNSSGESMYINLVSEEIETTGSIDFGEYTGVWRNVNDGTTSGHLPTLDASQYKLRTH